MILTTEQLQTANTYVSNKDFSKALEILCLIDIDTSSDLMGDYYLLLSEASLSLGELEQDFAEQAVLFFLKTSEHKKYALAKYLFGWQIQLLGNYANAKEPLNEAYSASLRCDDQFLSARILNRLSYVLFRSGDIEQTIKVLNKTKDIYNSLNLPQNILKADLNIAQIYFSCGDIRNSLKTYKLLLLSPSYNPKTNTSAILVMSLLYALQGKTHKALELIAIKNDDFSESQHQQFIYHEYYGQILMLNGQLKESLSQLNNGLKIALKTAPESDMISQIERLLGDAYLLLGDYKKSESHTTKALQVAERINERIEIAACYRIFAQLEHQKDNTDKAKEWFNKSIDLFNSISSYYELAVTQFMTAKSYLFSDYDTLEMLYEARKYFKSENINHYLTKVDSEISKLKNISVETSRKTASDKNACPAIITADKTMRNLLSLTKDISVAHDTVLITGDTGTGKELLAHYIHYHSGHTGKFITVNSATIPESIFESELFGYDKGAFTGANKTKKGKFELAENGTLFLDEIGEIPLLLQAKLLRVLEENKVERLGSVEKLPLNVRVIAATNKDLQELVDDNKFRSDLYYRLKVLTLQLPPLRERMSDIPALVEYFLCNFGHKINGDAKLIEQLSSILSERQWDGNIRELRNELKRLYLFADKSIEKMIELTATHRPQSDSDRLLSLLETTNWNQSETARVLNVSETTIRRRIKKYNILQNKSSLY